MNRRNFMKIVGGVLAGVAFVPKAKPQLTVAMLQNVKKDLDAKKVSGDILVPTWIASKKDIEAFQSGNCRYLEKMERLRIEAAEKAANPPYIIYPNGKIEQIPFKDLYKQV